MREEYKKIICKLSDHIEKEVLLLLARNFTSEQMTSDIIDLVISVHMSSLFNIMRGLSDEHSEMRKTVAQFIENTVSFLKCQEPITNVELVTISKKIK